VLEHICHGSQLIKTLKFTFVFVFETVWDIRQLYKNKSLLLSEASHVPAKSQKLEAGGKPF